MAVLILIGFVGLMLVLYAADRVRKALAHARHLRRMSARLAAATARTDEQQERQQAAVRASAELTSFLPAIRRPPLTVPGAAPRRPGDPDV